MAVSDWVNIFVGIAGVYLLWQQNQIFKQQNEIFAAQAKKAAKMPFSPSPKIGLRTYWPMLVMACLMILTWAGIGYQYFGTHAFETGKSLSIPHVPLSEDQKKIFSHLSAMESNWSIYPYEEVVGQHFENTSVLVDGKKFSNCTFSNVTFLFEGTAPFQFNGAPELHGVNRISTDLNVVKFVFNLFHDTGQINGPLINTVTH